MVSVPGTVLAHSPARTACYLGCPSIVVMPSGDYVASHSRVGPGTPNSDSVVYTSRDRGESWQQVSELRGQVWSNLFLHGGALYIMGTDHRNPADGRLNGRIVIRRSEDGGRTWTTPADARSGLLTDSEGWHTAPVPIALHEGRLWRAFEFAPTPDRRTWRALVVSAPAEADLLARSSWSFSRQADPWQGCQWIEGNVVAAPDGSLVDVLRSNDLRNPKLPAFVDRAALARVQAGGSELRHDPAVDTIQFPGGGTKFTIRFDPVAGRYFSLVNPQSEPGTWRNVLAVSSSSDLRQWRIDREILRHHESSAHAFQYVDWVFAGEDIIYLSRTAFDDDQGGAHNAHDANYITFHRLEGFRAGLKGR